MALTIGLTSYCPDLALLGELLTRNRAGLNGKASFVP